MPPAETQQSNQGHSNGDVWPDPEVKGRGRLPEHDPTNSVYAMNVLHEGRPLSINDIDRPVLVNHCYAVGEPQLTSKRLIRIDEYDEPSMDSSRNYQTQMPRGTQQVPLTGYKNYHQEFQTLPCIQRTGNGLTNSYNKQHK